MSTSMRKVAKLPEKAKSVAEKEKAVSAKEKAVPAQEKPVPEKKRYELISDIAGIGDATASKLKILGYSTVEALATATVKELETAGIGEKVAARVIMEARGTVSTSFVHVDELMRMRQDVLRLSTHSQNLDKLVGGGLESQMITEFYGEYGVGKSILCHQLAVDVQLPVTQGGLDGGALYIDTENTFRAEWIVRMAKALGLDPEAVGKRIIYSEAFNSDHQILILDRADKVIQENNIKLIIVDSLMAHFRSEFIGRENLAPRQQKLNSHLHRLTRLARAFNAVAVVTNQVMAKPDAFFAGVAAVGGHIVSHATHTRIFLRRQSTGPVRIARLVSNPYLPEGECLFQITNDGVKDITSEEAAEVKAKKQRFGTPGKDDGEDEDQ